MNWVFGGVEVVMGMPWLPTAVWANMPPPSYRVTVPAGREPLYEWAGPAFLALAIVAGGLWLLRGRTLRTGASRALLWAAAGFLAVSYSVWWVWANRDDVVLEPSWGARAAVSMPWLWAVACVVVIWRGRRRTRPTAAADPPLPEDAAEPGVAPDPRRHLGSGGA